MYHKDGTESGLELRNIKNNEVEKFKLLRVKHAQYLTVCHIFLESARQGAAEMSKKCKNSPGNQSVQPPFRMG